jgi:nickel transport protein
VIHRVTTGTATVVLLKEEDGPVLAGARFEVYPPEGERPWSTGMTDGQGAVVFLPDRPGPWRVRVWSEEGHGADLTVEVGAAGRPLRVSQGADAKAWKVLAGVAILGAAFALAGLWRERRRSGARHATGGEGAGARP